MTESYDDFENKAPEKYNLDILGEQASFLQDVATLIAELPSSAQAAKENYSFTFLILPLSTPYEIPSAIQEFMPEIENIKVYIGDAHIPENAKDTSRPAYISVEIESSDRIISTSRSGEDDTTEISFYQLHPLDIDLLEADSDQLGEAIKVGTISKAELNTLIMSIVLPSSIGDYTAYLDKELQSCEAFESLVELLSAQSYEKKESRMFFIRDGEAEIHYIKEANQLSSFTFTYFDTKRQSPMQVEYDIGSEFRLRFFTVDEFDKQLVIPTAEEINSVRALLTSELASLSASRLAFEDEAVIADTRTGESRQRVISNEMSGFTSELLGELGLNPPDTRA